MENETTTHPNSNADCHTSITPRYPHHHTDLLFQQDPFLKRRAYVVLRRTNNGLWTLPGGHVEPGEDFATAITRELQEELQISGIKNTTLLNEMELIDVKTKKKRTIVLFEGEYTTPLTPINVSVINDPKYQYPEHFEFRWVSYKKELDFLEFAFKEFKDLLREKLN